MTAGFIPEHGGYKKLKSYQKSVVIYDATIYFCKRFFKHDYRQTDQMQQAARSGKQNIIEGSLASATSKQTEIHLTNVAKASLGELLEDYEDFLRVRHLPIWQKDHPSAVRLTNLSRRAPDAYETYADAIENESPEVSANTIRHLIIQACYMLSKQIQRLEQDFLQKGGIRERMTAARREVISQTSSKSSPSSSSSATASVQRNCPQCGSPMVLRTARTGKFAGQPFYGCSKYPECRGTSPVEKGTI